MNEIEGGAPNFFWNHDNIMMGEGKSKTKPPYWYGCTNECVCIIVPSNDYLFCRIREGDMLERFANNKHVYLLILRNAFKMDYEDQEGESVFFGNDNNLLVCEMALEYTAQVVKVRLAKEKGMPYFKCLFDNWVHSMGYRTEKGFPKERIVKSILAY